MAHGGREVGVPEVLLDSLNGTPAIAGGHVQRVEGGGEPPAPDHPRPTAGPEALGPTARVDVVVAVASPGQVRWFDASLGALSETVLD